jgi:hypothetical protein
MEIIGCRFISKSKENKRKIKLLKEKIKKYKVFSKKRRKNYSFVEYFVWTYN